jgi:hypothetical protein
MFKEDYVKSVRERLQLGMKHIYYFFPFVRYHSAKLLHPAVEAICFQGDGNIRYYEVVDQAPWLHYLNQFLSGSPQVCIC